MVAASFRGDLKGPMEISMHRFKVGQRVHFSAANIERGAAGIYKVVAQLPEEYGDNQYRIQSASGPRERVAKESQLSPVEAS
jgi:hypothetical protein